MKKPILEVKEIFSGEKVLSEYLFLIFISEYEFNDNKPVLIFTDFQKGEYYDE